MCDENLYQFPTQGSQPRPDPYGARQKLERQLKSLPYRNTLVLGGQSPEEQTQFVQRCGTLQLINNFGLTSLQVHDPSPMFIGPRGKSTTIDYVFMRRAESRCLNTFSLAERRLYPDHLPCLSSIPANWKVWYRAPAKEIANLTKQDVNYIHLEQRENTVRWQDFIQKVETYLATASTTDAQTPVQWIAHLAKQTFCRAPTQQLPLWMEGSARSLVARKWKHLHYARLGNSCESSSCLLFSCLASCSHVFSVAQAIETALLTTEARKTLCHHGCSSQGSANHDASALYQIQRIS